MTKADLIAALRDLPDTADVLIDVMPWDEPLNLTAVADVRVYDEQAGSRPFATLVPSTDGATRLDPQDD